MSDIPTESDRSGVMQPEFFDWEGTTPENVLEKIVAFYRHSVNPELSLRQMDRMLFKFLKEKIKPPGRDALYTDKTIEQWTLLSSDQQIAEDIKRSLYYSISAFKKSEQKQRKTVEHYAKIFEKMFKDGYKSYSKVNTQFAATADTKGMAELNVEPNRSRFKTELALAASNLVSKKEELLTTAAGAWEYGILNSDKFIDRVNEGPDDPIYHLALAAEMTRVRDEDKVAHIHRLELISDPNSSQESNLANLETEIPLPVLFMNSITVNPTGTSNELTVCAEPLSDGKGIHVPWDRISCLPIYHMSDGEDFKWTLASERFYGINLGTPDLGRVVNKQYRRINKRTKIICLGQNNILSI